MNNAMMAGLGAGLIVTIKVVFGEQISNLPDWILWGVPVLVFGSLAGVTIWGIYPHWKAEGEARKGQSSQSGQAFRHEEASMGGTSAEDDLVSGQDPRVAKMYALFEELNRDTEKLYANFDNISRLELSIFNVSMVSFCIQNFSELSGEDKDVVVNRFVDLCVANLLLDSPNADFHVLRDTLVVRFNDYFSYVVNFFGSQGGDEAVGSSSNLLQKLDSFVGINRGAFLAQIEGMRLGAILSDLSVNVRHLLLGKLIPVPSEAEEG